MKINPNIKRFGPIALLILAVWAILTYLKPKVYDIALPAVNACTTPMPEAILSGEQFLALLPAYVKKWDSITLSEGLSREDLDDQSNFAFKKNALPLQLIKYWKSGFAYNEVVCHRSAFPDDTCCLEGSDYLSALGFWDNSQPGIYKENYEEQVVLLRLEKKKPLKIVALWENFAIQGETNGELIKIKIPKCANDFENSLIRVWCADSNQVSPVCEIPLVHGQVAVHFHALKSPSLKESEGRIKALFSSGFRMDSVQLGLLNASILKATEADELKLVLNYGDIRFDKQNTDYGMVVYNYFGKKLLVIWNKTNKILKLQLPVKGDFKHSTSGLPFVQKSGKLNLTLGAAGVEVLY